MLIKRLFKRLLFPLVLLVGLSSCGDGELIQNPMVDRWCGERPCTWDASGRIRRVGTWHTDDYAVELLGSNSSLSQVNATLNADKATCLDFSMIADISARTKVFVELDFLDDEVIDFSQQIPESHWARRTFLIRTPSWYRGVRFIVRKEGSGRAALAELRARAGSGCTKPPVELLNRPNGAACESDEQCEGARCSRGACAFCHGDEDCEAGELCGFASDGSTFADRCVRPASADFGEPCTSNSQCGDGTMCCEGVCSSCCPGSRRCDDGLRCSRSERLQPLILPLPFQCGPREWSTASGGPCIGAEDCRSGICEGAAIRCARCADEPDEADGGVESCTRCTSWRLQGGTCD